MAGPAAAGVTLVANTYGNPQFAQPSLSAAAADFRLRRGSPAIDTAAFSGNGVPRFDLNGVPRPTGSSSDRGAYEGVVDTLLGQTVPSSSVADNPVELGVKLTVSQSGRMVAVRFYKSAGESGTHTARIWNANGTLLRTQTFGTETASGWQSVPLASPLTLTANQTVVVSVNANARYAVASSGFVTPLTAGTLTAPGGSNGVYTYTTGTFPTLSYQSTNYYRDVIFLPD